MNRFLKHLLTLSFSATISSHSLVAQVIFSQAGKPASASQTDTVANINRPELPGFTVSYFDSTAHATHQESVRNQRAYSRIDSLLGQAADSLFREIEQREGVVRSPTLGRAAERLQFVPAIPPVRFATWQDYQVSSRFGWRIHPIGGDTRLHNGLDMPQPTGTPVYATAFGVVKWTSWQPDGLGLSICVEHPTGYQTIYGHLSAYSVRQGENVRRGALIGRVGSTGRSTGPHLHYTILYRGKPVDPARYCFLWVKLARTGWWRLAGPETLPTRRAK